ncbi:hypothetical protein ABK040_005491 [Willaertia magna]
MNIKSLTFIRQYFSHLPKCHYTQIRHFTSSLNRFEFQKEVSQENTQNKTKNVLPIHDYEVLLHTAKEEAKIIQEHNNIIKKELKGNSNAGEAPIQTKQKLKTLKKNATSLKDKLKRKLQK